MTTPYSHDETVSPRTNYKRGCKCSICKKANLEYQQAYRREQARRGTSKEAIKRVMRRDALEFLEKHHPESVPLLKKQSAERSKVKPGASNLR